MCLLIRWVLLLWMLPGFGLVASGTVHGGHTGNENVRDSVVLSLGDSAVIQVCIDSTIHLSCPLTIGPKNILSCKWTNNRTAEVYEATNIWVSPDTTTEYRLEVIYIESDKNLIRNGDFEAGNTLFYTEYKWASGSGDKALWTQGTYKMAQNAGTYHQNFDDLNDHTTGYGTMMVVNGDTVPNITVWRQEIGNVEADKQYAFSAWLATISEGTSPRFRFAINDEPLGNTFAPLHGEGWRQFYYIWTAKDNRALISLVDSVVEQNGNDFVLDDISFAPVHRAVAKVKVSVLPRLVLNDLGSVCEQDGFPVIVGSGMTDYEWKKLGTGWSSTERIPDLSALEEELPGRYSCYVKGYCGEIRDTFEILKQLKVSAVRDTVTVCSDRGMAQLGVVAEGNGVTYEWCKKGSSTILSHDSVYNIGYSYWPIKWGTYICRVSSYCGTRDVEVVFMKGKVRFLQLPRDTVICRGNEVCWVVKASMDAEVSWTLPDGSSRTGDTLRALAEGTYRYSVNGCNRGEVLTGEVRLGVHPFPGVLSFERDRDTLCEGESFSLSSGFSDRGLSYEWRHEGVVYGSDTCCISLGSVSAADTGWYVLKLTDVCGISQSDSVHLSLYPSLSLPSSFRDLSVCPGADVRLESSASGSGLSFLWDRGEGRDRSYSLSGVSDSDSGYYHCRVTDVCGEVKRDTFHLQVLRLPEILYITPDVLSEEGSSHRIGALAVGDSLSWSWSHDGVALSSQDSFLVFDALSYSDSGRYEVKVGNRCRVVTAHSDVRTYWVASLPDFLGNSVERCEGTEVRLQVEVEDTTGLVCEWYREDSLMVGAHSFDLDFPALRKEDAAFYTCRIKGRGWSKELDYKLEVLDSLRLMTLPAELRVCEGETTEFRIYASGSGVTYEWLPAGEGWQGKSDSVLFKDAVVVADSGRYVCRIGSLCGNKDVETGLSVEGEVRLMSMLRDTVVCTGDSLVWRVEINYGDAEVFWQLPDGSSRSGKSLTLINIQPEQAGIYRYQARGFCGKTVWKEVSLDVHPFLEPIHFASSMQSYCLYDSVNLISPVMARGLKYMWFKGKEAVSAECIFGIGRITASDTGVYSLQVTDVCGLVQRDSIRLGLYPQLKIKSSELSRSVCEGDSVVLEVRAEGKDVAYRWGNRGIKDSVMVLNPVALVDAGVYDCRVSSRCGDTVVSGRVTVNALPEIVLNLSPWAGSCMDSVVLSGSMPAGGVYRIKGKPVTVAHFEAEGNECEVSYYYRDSQTGCEAADSLRIRKAERPELVLQPDADIGACQSLSLEILRASAGEIHWENALLDVSDRNHPVYTPAAGEEGEVKIAAVLTDIYGCEARDTVCVRVTALPEIEVSSDTVIGECNELKLEIRYDAERLGDIRWEPATGLEVGENYTAVLTDPAVGINVWTAVMTDRFGCEVRKPVKVTVVAAPREEWRESCEGEKVMADCRGYAFCVWNDGREDSVRVLTLPGEYKAVVTDRYGCQGEMSWSVHALPAFTLADTFIFEEQTIHFELTDLKEPYGVCRIVWWNGREDFRSEEVTTEGYYRVTVSDPIGCSFTDSLFLEVKKRGIKAPNAFLPNSEGENSRFYLKEVNFIGNFEMCIYDRWGELVYVTKEIGFNGGWNGTFKGTGCQPGAYMWVARNNGKIIGRGTVILVK